MEKNTFEQQVIKIESLVNDLVQAGLKLDFIASKVKEYSESRIKADKTVISKIKSGDIKFTKSQDLLPEWISVLEKVKRLHHNSIGSQIENLAGLYLGFYYEEGTGKVKKIFLRINQNQTLELKSKLNYYTGNFKINENIMVLELLSSLNKDFVVLFGNLNYRHTFQIHIQVMRLFSCFGKDGGTMVAENMFFHLENHDETYDNINKITVSEFDILEEKHKTFYDFFIKEHTKSSYISKSAIYFDEIG